MLDPSKEQHRPTGPHIKNLRRNSLCEPTSVVFRKEESDQTEFPLGAPTSRFPDTRYPELRSSPKNNCPPSPKPSYTSNYVSCLLAHPPVRDNVTPSYLSSAMNLLDASAGPVDQPQVQTLFRSQSAPMGNYFTPVCIPSTPTTKEQTTRKTREEVEVDEHTHNAHDKTHSCYQATRALLLKFALCPSSHEMLSHLEDDEGQNMADFLDRVLSDGEFLDQTQRRRTLDLIIHLAKSSQIFPENLKMEAFEFDQSRAHDGGGYGLIYKVCHQNRLVSVKVPQLVNSQQANHAEILKAHAKELMLLGYISHPNVLPLEGIFLSRGDTQHICMVSPWMENGNLVKFLNCFPEIFRLPLILDVTTGLRYLHELRVVHGDLKGTNVLISSTGRAVLADFGISRVLVTGRSGSRTSCGTTHWMAPELLDESQHPSLESDIWAYAGVCYEVFTGWIPFYQFTPAQLLAAFIRGGAIPIRPTLRRDGGRLDLDDRTWDLLKDCWSPDPHKRPTSEDIHNFFKSLDILDNRPPIEKDPYLTNLKEARSRSITFDCPRVYEILRRITLCTDPE